jgi:hypothetical protein
VTVSGCFQVGMLIGVAKTFQELGITETLMRRYGAPAFSGRGISPREPDWTPASH